MKLGIDVSEHNGINNWQAIAAAGVKFAIIRAGFGEDSLDERFYDNVNGALAAGIEIGVYWFCYATCRESLQKEMDFLLALLKDCGLTPDKVPMGVFLDVEDDSYRPFRHWPGLKVVNEMCHAFCDGISAAGYKAGIYSSASWFGRDSYIQGYEFRKHTVWVAEWNPTCTVEEANIWQFTDHLLVNGKVYDGNYILG